VLCKIGRMLISSIIDKVQGKCRQELKSAHSKNASECQVVCLMIRQHRGELVRSIHNDMAA
jgi:hypothetical protein